MNVAVIFSGGIGKRMGNSTIPKQFLKLHNKPILVYTLELFQHNPDIDGIVIVMVGSWIKKTERLVKGYQLDKVWAVVAGGATGQESRRLGIAKVRELCPDGTMVLMHDGVRPLLDEEVISSNLELALREGNAVTTAPVTETVVTLDEDGSVANILNRQDCFAARAPQTFRLEDLYACYQRAEEEGLEFIDTASLMRHYGHKIYTMTGNSDNIKITTPIDFYLFKAYVEAREQRALFGVEED